MCFQVESHRQNMSRGASYRTSRQKPINFGNGRFSDGIDIRTEAEKIGIPHLIHFTRCENLESILRHGLLSVASCKAKRLTPFRNDTKRFDGQLNGVSLSVAFPNYKMFYKYRMLNESSDWVVLILSKNILWEKECGFYRCNAAASCMLQEPRARMTTLDAFQEMFRTIGGPRDPCLRQYDPTDPQAEVMVYEPIEPYLIEAVAFETAEIAENWSRAVGGRNIVCAGQDHGLFSIRERVRKRAQMNTKNTLFPDWYDMMPCGVGSYEIMPTTKTNPFADGSVREEMTGFRVTEDESTELAVDEQDGLLARERRARAKELIAEHEAQTATTFGGVVGFLLGWLLF